MRSRLAGTAALITMLAAAEAQACAFHITGLGGFDLAYPGSMRVALAVAEAKLYGNLPQTILPEGDEGLRITSNAMKTLGDRLDQIPQDSMADFYILLVDRRLWTRYYVETYSDGKAYNVYVHTSAPEEDIPVALMTYDVLEALATEKMTVSEAVDAGLIQIQGQSPDQVSTALNLAYGIDLASR